jgi:hypothetical protein
MIMYPSSQTLNLQERIKQLAERVREEALALPDGDEQREELLLRAQRMAGEAIELVMLSDQAGDRLAAL